MAERGAFEDAMDAAFANVRWMLVGARFFNLLRPTLTAAKFAGTRRKIQQKLRGFFFL
jgi:hypothetical protein